MHDFERKFWQSMNERKTDRIAYAATVVFLCGLGCAVTAVAAWLLSLE